MDMGPFFKTQPNMIKIKTQPTKAIRSLYQTQSNSPQYITISYTTTSFLTQPTHPQ